MSVILMFWYFTIDQPVKTLRVSSTIEHCYRTLTSIYTETVFFQQTLQKNMAQLLFSIHTDQIVCTCKSSFCRCPAHYYKQNIVYCTRYMRYILKRSFRQEMFLQSAIEVGQYLVVYTWLLSGLSFTFFILFLSKY